MDANRLEQFHETKVAYDAMPEVKEFVIMTRQYKQVQDYLHANKLDKDVRLFKYTHKVGFNPSKAFNMGVLNAKYDNIIITSPEVRPKTEVLKQLAELDGKNVVCQVWDEDSPGIVGTSLVYKGFRDRTPGYYFLAKFNKKDIEAINGWDEEFMKGYAYEDDDFGERWVRAGLPFEIHEEIQAIHQWHPRSETIPSGGYINYDRLQQNNADGITRCFNGLQKLTIQ